MKIIKPSARVSRPRVSSESLSLFRQGRGGGRKLNAPVDPLSGMNYDLETLMRKVRVLPENARKAFFEKWNEEGLLSAIRNVLIKRSPKTRSGLGMESGFGTNIFDTSNFDEYNAYFRGGNRKIAWEAPVRKSMRDFEARRKRNIIRDIDASLEYRKANGQEGTGDYGRLLEMRSALADDSIADRLVFNYNGFNLNGMSNRNNNAEYVRAIMSSDTPEKYQGKKWIELNMENLHNLEHAKKSGAHELSHELYDDVVGKNKVYRDMLDEAMIVPKDNFKFVDSMSNDEKYTVLNEVSEYFRGKGYASAYDIPDSEIAFYSYDPVTRQQNFGTVFGNMLGEGYRTGYLIDYNNGVMSELAPLGVKGREQFVSDYAMRFKQTLDHLAPLS